MILAAMVFAANSEFFIISSIDLSKNRVLLKRPTEVSVVAAITPATDIRGEHGERLRFADLRAGDTLYAVAKADPNGQLVLTTIRLGPMTVSELRRRYLQR